MVEVASSDRNKIAKKMALPVDNFRSGYMQKNLSEQNSMYINLLLHILHEIKSLGFKVVIIAAGHYPLIDYARAAAAIFHQSQNNPKTIVWSFSGYELVKDLFPQETCGDHGGKWETSMLMSLDPGTIDLSKIKGAPNAAPIGVSNNGVEDSNAKFGKKIVDAISKRVANKVKYLLDHYDEFQGHGAP